MTVGKLSVSLDTSLMDFMTHYQETHQLSSRSEVIAHALTLLRDRELETQYAAALADWQTSGEADLWDHAAADGLQEETDAAR